MQFDEEMTTNLTSNVPNQHYLKGLKGPSSAQINSNLTIPVTSNDSNIDLEAAKKFNADLMSSLVARKMSKNKTFYEIKVQAANQANYAAMGHLHGLSGAGLTSNMPTGHFT